MRFRKRTLWLLLIALLYSVLAVSPAFAHALLVRSNPVANAVLQEPPVQVELFFSEPLESQLSSVQIFDSNKSSVDAGDVRVDPADPTRMTVSLRSLNDGVYTVTWKAVSSVDGHQTVGAFPFAVGNVDAMEVNAIRQSTSFHLPFTMLISKYLMLVSLVLLLGHRLFIALIWVPALIADRKESASVNNLPDVWKTLYRAGLIGTLVAIGLGILAQAGQSLGKELAFPWNVETGHILMETRLGVIWLVRLALALLSVWFAWRADSAWKDWSAFAVNLALLFTLTLTSHAATDARPLLPILADWLHLIGMAFWLGGLAYFLAGVRSLRPLRGELRTRLTSSLTTRFSANALVFVGLIGLTGLYSAFLRVGSLAGLLDTLYGHVLLIKQAFVAGLLIIAATNLLIVSPRLKQNRLQAIADVGLVERFGRLLIIELAFGGLLLASVSFLTYLPPAKVAAANTDLRSRIKVDDLTVQILISPGRVGQNTFTLTVSTSNGRPLQSAKEVLLRFTSRQANIPPSELELIGQGNGTFVAKSAHLSMPGDWQVQAVVRRQDRFDAFANFDFVLQRPGGSNQSIAIPRQTGVLLVCLGLLCALFTFYTTLNPVLRFGTGIPATLLLIGLGVFSLARPIPVNIERVNPVPPGSESIAAGQALFTTICAPCHGRTGKGDGPIGLTLNPRPADLSQHAIPGIHTDAQLFEWITNGFPGSRMPAFKSTLSDTDRWNLVNFIRTLAPR